MLHQDKRLLDPFRPRKQMRFHLSWKQYIKRVVCLNTQTCFSVIRGLSLKCHVTKLLEKYNVHIRSTTTKYKKTHTVFVKAFNKELAKLLFKAMDAQGLQNPKKVSTIWVKNVSSTVNKMSNTKPSLIDMKPKDAIKLDTVQLNKTYPEESVLPEDGLYRHLHQPGEQNGD